MFSQTSEERRSSHVASQLDDLVDDDDRHDSIPLQYPQTCLHPMFAMVAFAEGGKPHMTRNDVLDASVIDHRVRPNYAPSLLPLRGATNSV